MRNVSINGVQLTPSQVEWLRELFILNIVSNSETIRTVDGDLTVFYHYRRLSLLALQLIDNDPLMPLQQQVASRVPWLCDEPVVLMDGVQMNFHISMITRIVISSAGFHNDKLDALRDQRGLDINDIDDLLAAVFKRPIL